MFIISRTILIRIRIIGDSIVEKIKTHILCSNSFFEMVPLMRQREKNVVESDRPQMAIQFIAYAMHAEYQKLQTHTQNMQ